MFNNSTITVIHLWMIISRSLFFASLVSCTLASQSLGWSPRTCDVEPDVMFNISWCARTSHQRASKCLVLSSVLSLDSMWAWCLWWCYAPQAYLSVSRFRFQSAYYMCTTGPLTATTGHLSDLAAISMISSYSLNASFLLYLPIPDLLPTSTQPPSLGVTSNDSCMHESIRYYSDWSLLLLTQYYTALLVIHFHAH